MSLTWEQTAKLLHDKSVEATTRLVPLNKRVTLDFNGKPIRRKKVKPNG